MSAAGSSRALPCLSSWGTRFLPPDMPAVTPARSREPSSETKGPATCLLSKCLFGGVWKLSVNAHRVTELWAGVPAFLCGRAVGPLGRHASDPAQTGALDSGGRDTDHVPACRPVLPATGLCDR